MNKLIPFFAAAIFTGLTANAGLIISQYYEGAGSDKWIEIYNPGTASVDLAAGDFRLGLWSNANRELWKTGTAPAGSLILSGVLTAGSTFQYSHASAVLPSYAVPATQTSSTVMNFNGDDSVVLYTGATFAFANVVDVFGATLALGTFAGEKSFTRKFAVNTGVNTDFNAADWDEKTLAVVAGATSTTPEYLGYHTAETTVVPEPASAGLLALGLLLLRRLRR